MRNEKIDLFGLHNSLIIRHLRANAW